MLKNKNFLSMLFILAVTCLIFFKIFLKGLYPVPGDLLVSFYFPYYSGGWKGYNPWTTHKELLGADAIRQIYLWKEFAANELKRGSWPLWNPYTFSGQPLLANFQSSVLYPFNVFYFLTESRNAWVLLIIIQPFLGGVFMYFAARSFNLSSIASTLAAAAFMFSSYLVTWMENGNISHSYIWLPSAFWATNRFFDLFKFRFLFIFILSLTLSVLAGHPQTAIYIYLITTLYWIFKTFDIKKGKVTMLAQLALSIVSSLLLAAVQLLPTYYFYKISPISLPFSKEVFDRAIMPYQNLITFFASDFFGHPANNNFWSQTYGDFTPYIGVVPLIFFFWGTIRAWSTKFVKFAALTSAFFILSAVHGPITFAIKTFQIPLLDSTTPSRFISISIFLMIIVSAIGFADFIKNFESKVYLKKFLKFSGVLGIVYVAMWFFAAFGQNFLRPNETWQMNLAVTKRNLILPTLMYLTLPVGILTLQLCQNFRFMKSFPFKKVFIAGIFTTILVGGVYFTNKFLPTSPKNYIFPEHPLFNWLKTNAHINRFYGGQTAHIDFNFPTHYGIYGAEGYDTLRIERYAQLLASSFTGKVPTSYLRSDAVFPNEENGYRKRLFDLLGVKYLLDKEDNPKTNADWHYERFPNDKVEGLWQQGKFQIYNRPTAIPRIFLTTNYQVSTDEEIIKSIYDPNFDLRTLLLEKEPSINLEKKLNEIVIPEILQYRPGEILLKTNSNDNALLFVSDVHDPDWTAEVDGKTAPVLRAHYALMATEVPSGEHTVRFAYKPKSFVIGAYGSILSIILLLGFGLYMYKRRKF